MAVAHRADGVTVAGPCVAQQDRVAVVGVELAPRLVGDDDIVERHAAVERERAGEAEELPMADWVALVPCAACRHRLARHLLLLVLVVAVYSTGGRRTREASLPCEIAGPHPRRSRMAPWGFLPGCRIDAPKDDDHS